MSYIGDFRLGDTFDTKFTTVNTSGVPTTLAGSPVISAYVGNNTTELTAGITLTVDFDSRTGMHNVRVVASGGNGYATASNYQLVITTGTVGGSSVVGYVVGEFSIEARSALMPTTAARTLDVSATGEGGVDWANVGSPTTTLALTGTTIATTQKVDVETIKTNPVVNGGTITFPTTATLASTTNITAGTITTATTVTTVNGLAANVITAASIATGAIDADALATDAVNEIADGVWDEQLSGHTTAGSAGKALSDAGSAGDPWSTALPGAYSAGSAGFIVGTNLDAAVTTRLAPTVAARTLDVTATGAAGIDWANVENPTTALNLSATNIDTDQVVASVTGAVGSVTGAVGSVTGNVGGNVVGSVASVTGNVGGNVVGTVASVVGNVGGNVVGSVASVVAGVTVTTNNDKTGYALSSAGVDAILDDAVDGSVTVRQSLRLNNSGAGGKLSGAATTTVAIRDLADTKDRVTATVDADGNRTAVTLDLT